MWTAPIILLTAEPSTPITTVALYRSGEVILGALIGGSFHWLAKMIVNALPRARTHRADVNQNRIEISDSEFNGGATLNSYLSGKISTFRQIQQLEIILQL